MKVLNLIPYGKEIFDWITQAKRIKQLERERDEYKEKFEACIKGFNKHLKGQLLKTRGGNK